MKLKIYLFLFLTFFSFGASNAEDIKVLFIGNSFTYYNNMPAILEGISKANPDGPQIIAQMHASGGRELKESYEMNDLQELLEKGNWDWVVLQDQSTLGNTNFINGDNYVLDPNPFFMTVKAWEKKIQETGAEPILFSTWLGVGAPDFNTKTITWAYQSIGRELDIPVVEMGLAWNSFKKSFPDMNLYWEDDFHPSSLGSLLIASMFYKELTGADLKNVIIPTRYRGQRVEENDGKIFEDQIVEIGNISISEIEAVRGIGNTDFRSFIPLIRPENIGFKTLNPDILKTTKPEDFVGIWTGKTIHYPKMLPSPGDMKITISMTENGILEGHLNITFEGVNYNVSQSMENILLQDGVLSFEDVNGFNQSVVKYEAGILANGQLTGIANLNNEELAIKMNGDWVLTRE